MSSSNLVRIAYKKENTYGTKLNAVKASLVVQDLTYTAAKGGEGGNVITITYTGGGTAGAEVVTVLSNSISVQIENAVSTATQVKAAIDASAAALALVSVAITGTGATAQNTAVSAPLTGGLHDFKQLRFVSEKYSGTPTTVESAQIRTDRMSSGQVVTGLQVPGGHNIELAKETAIEDFMESAMYNAWDSKVLVNGTFAIDATAKTLTRSAGSFVDEGLVVGDIIVLSNFVTTGNNVPVMVTAVGALTVSYAGPTGMADASAEAASYQRADKLSIGITTKSLTIEKSFLDLTTKALIYKGAIANQMDLNVQYGQLISGSFETQANDYESADSASEFISYQEYIDNPATSESMNGSVDMPFLTTDVTGSFAQDTFCIQTLKLTLNNNLQPQTCIGRSAPEAYSAGTAQIKVSLDSYLKDSNWDLLAKKLDQSSFAVGFMVKNVDGWYGFYLPAIQVSFDDPASGGANQQISMSMSGTAKVGANGESALSIFRIPS